MDVTKLIKDLSTNNVAHFEGYGIKVSFHKVHNYAKSNNSLPLEIKNSIETPKSEPIIDPAMAQTLEGETDYDKILNWSSPSEIKLPLSGEAPLTTEG